MVEIAKPGTVKVNGPRMLPTVTLTNGKTYFFDERLNQLWNIKNTHDHIDDCMTALSLKDVEAVQRCYGRFTDLITIRCSECWKVLFTGTEDQSKGLIIYCTDCASPDGDSHGK